MEINQSEIFDIDWDWFAVDQEGSIGHFTTGGFRSLPTFVRVNKESLELVTDYFLNLPINSHNLLKTTLSENIKDENKLLDWSSFLNMAARGLYSYDTELLHGPNACYYLAAAPIVPIKYDELPLGIKNLLAFSKLPIHFSVSSKITEKQTLDSGTKS